MFAEHKIETTLAVSIKCMVSSNIPVATNPHSTNDINSCHFFVRVPEKYKEETVNMAVRQLMGFPCLCLDQTPNRNRVFCPEYLLG